MNLGKIEPDTFLKQNIYL